MKNQTRTLKVIATGYTEVVEVDLTDFKLEKDGNLHMITYQGNPVEFIQVGEVELNHERRSATVTYSRWRNPDCKLEWYPESQGSSIYLSYLDATSEGFDPEEVLKLYLPDMFEEAVKEVPSLIFNWVDHR